MTHLEPVADFDAIYCRHNVMRTDECPDCLPASAPVADLDDWTNERCIHGLTAEDDCDDCGQNFLTEPEEQRKLADARNAARAYDACTFTGSVYTGDEILELPKPDPLVGTWLDRGVVAEVHGEYGSGKTHLLLELGMSVATGVPWYGQEIHHVGQVLYVAAEGGYTFPDRFAGWLERYDDDESPIGNFGLYPHRFDLTSLDSWRHLRAALELGVERGHFLQPSLIILDTRARLASGDEVSNMTGDKLIEACDIIREIRPQTTIIFAHHPALNGKGRGRGHTGFEAALDVVWGMEGKLRDGPVKLTDLKQKARECNPPMWLKLATTATGKPYLERADQRPDTANADRTVELIERAIRDNPGAYTARQIEKEPPAELTGLGSQRRRAEAIRLLRNARRIREVDPPEGQKGRRLEPVEGMDDQW